MGSMRIRPRLVRRCSTRRGASAVPASRVTAWPAGLGIPEAAAVWVAYSTAYGALVEKAGMRPGDHVLITAASGGVGRAAMQIANQIGAAPIAVTRHPAKKDELLAAAPPRSSPPATRTWPRPSATTLAGPAPTSSSTLSWAPASPIS